MWYYEDPMVHSCNMNIWWYLLHRITCIKKVQYSRLDTHELYILKARGQIGYQIKAIVSRCNIISHQSRTRKCISRSIRSYFQLLNSGGVKRCERPTTCNLYIARHWSGKLNGVSPLVLIDTVRPFSIIQVPVTQALSHAERYKPIQATSVPNYGQLLANSHTGAERSAKTRAFIADFNVRSPPTPSHYGTCHIPNAK